jgi:hypothetical protein
MVTQSTEATDTPAVIEAPDAPMQEDTESIAADTPDALPEETLESLKAERDSLRDAKVKSDALMKQLEERSGTKSLVAKIEALQEEQRGLSRELIRVGVKSDVELTDFERKSKLAEVDEQVEKAAVATKFATERNKLGAEVERLLTKAGLPLDTSIPEVATIFGKWQEARSSDDLADVVLSVGNLLTQKTDEKVKALEAEVEAERKRANQEEGVLNIGTGARGGTAGSSSDNAFIDQYAAGDSDDHARYRKVAKARGWMS